MAAILRSRQACFCRKWYQQLNMPARYPWTFDRRWDLIDALAEILIEWVIILNGLFWWQWTLGSMSTGNPLHSRALAHSRAPLFTQPCPHCSHSRAPGEQWARLCVFTLQGCVQVARLCRGSPVMSSIQAVNINGHRQLCTCKVLAPVPHS